MKGNVVVMGDIALATEIKVSPMEPEPCVFRRSLLIQFPDADALRDAIDAGICEFTYLDRGQALIDE